MLRKDQKMIQRAEVAVNMARKDYYPDVTINGGYYNMGRMPDMFMLRADFKIPLYFFRKQRAAVTEQVQTLLQSRKVLEATNQGLNFRLQDDYLMAQTSEQLVRLYRETVIPQASLALEASLASYETGAVDFLTVFMNYITVVEYEMNYYEQMQDLYIALARLEEMTDGTTYDLEGSASIEEPAKVDQEVGRRSPQARDQRDQKRQGQDARMQESGGARQGSEQERRSEGRPAV